LAEPVDGDTYFLIGAGDLSEEQRRELKRICDDSIDAYLQARGETIWSHRRRGHRPISGAISLAGIGSRRLPGIMLGRVDVYLGGTPHSKL
jgi:hypothetical protein